MGDIRKAVKDYILETFLPGEDASAFDDEMDLREHGILDSRSMLSLMMFVEEMFQVRLEPGDVQSGDMSSIERIEKLVLSRRASSGGDDPGLMDSNDGLAVIAGGDIDSVSSPETRWTRSLCQAILDVASREQGRNVAVVDGRSQLTYGELVRQSGAFCDELLSAGIQPHDKVVVILGNSTEFLVAAFGIWRCGGVLVPLNPQLQDPELRKYLAGSSIRAIVTAPRNSSFVHALEQAGTALHAWIVPAEGGRWSHRGPIKSDHLSERVPAEIDVQPDWPAITMYSTGSTGYPKQVTRSHGKLLKDFRAMHGVLKMTPNDRIVGVTPFFHNYGLTGAALMALLSGGVLYAVDAFFPRELAQLIERERITGFSGVPFMFQALADLKEQHDLSSLRFAVSSGAPLRAETVRAFEDRYGIAIRAHYGSTETGCISIRGEDGRAGDPTSVGYAIPGVSVRIVDDAGKTVPVDTLGRVEVTSQFAASGYDNAGEGGESYFTGPSFFPGDLGRISADGELILSGRHRGFINVSGSKVDPSEVESVLLELPGVAEVTVFGVPDRVSGEKVKAVLVTSTHLSPTDIRTHCARRLAEFKHPKAIEFRKELPRSPLGKVLRKYLMDDVGDEQT